MRRASLLLGVALFVFLLGCAGSEPEPGSAAASGPEDLVARAAEIAAAIEAEPEVAEEILERFGVTVEEFEQMMFEIAADPELSKAFEAAR